MKFIWKPDNLTAEHQSFNDGVGKFIEAGEISQSDLYVDQLWCIQL